MSQRGISEEAAAQQSPIDHVPQDEYNQPTMPTSTQDTAVPNDSHQKAASRSRFARLVLDRHT